MICSGIYTALITPFNTSDQLDLAGFRQLVRLQEEADIDGILVLGTTGETPTLSPSEKESIIKTAREKWTKPTLMVGCGTYSTTQTLENIFHAKACGADSALIITPFYNKPTQEGIFCHFEVLSRASPLPIVVYNNPARTCINIEIQTLQRIAQLPGVIGVKETSGSVLHMSEILQTIKQERPEFAVLAGDDNMAFVTRCLGGDGVISGVSNIFPEAVKQLYFGDFKTAQKLNGDLTPLFKALVVETNPIPLKALMLLAGLPSGNPRLPLTPLSSKWISLFQNLLKDMQQQW